MEMEVGLHAARRAAKAKGKRQKEKGKGRSRGSIHEGRLNAVAVKPSNSSPNEKSPGLQAWAIFTGVYSDRTPACPLTASGIPLPPIDLRSSRTSCRPRARIRLPRGGVSAVLWADPLLP
jgi:hypothetical protein